MIAMVGVRRVSFFFAPFTPFCPQTFLSGVLSSQKKPHLIICIPEFSFAYNVSFLSVDFVTFFAWLIQLPSRRLKRAVDQRSIFFSVIIP